MTPFFIVCRSVWLPLFDITKLGPIYLRLNTPTTIQWSVPPPLGSDQWSVMNLLIPGYSIDKQYWSWQGDLWEFMDQMFRTPGVKPSSHLFMYVYIFVSHQDSLEHRKCFHSCIYVCVIRVDRYQVRFKWMTQTYPVVGYGSVPLMMSIYIWHALCLIWMHHACTMQLQRNGSTTLCTDFLKLLWPL